MFSPITTHQTDAIARLISQYANSEALKNLISAFVLPVQGIEDALETMNTLRGIYTAEGAILDRIGVIVGLTRTPGDDDDTYRRKLLGKIKVNTSEGAPETVIQAYQLFTGVDQVLLFEDMPGEVIIQSIYAPADQDEVDFLLGVIEKVLAAGVRIASIDTYDATEAFAMDGDLPGLGFDDDAAPGSGGKLAYESVRDSFFEIDGSDAKGGGFGSEGDPLLGGQLEAS